MTASLPIPTEDLADFCRRHGVKELAIFGSAVRSDFRPESDVDVLVEFYPEVSLDWETWLAMEAELSRMFGGHRIDLIERQTLKNPFRRASILASRQVLYAA